MLFHIIANIPLPYIELKDESKPVDEIVFRTQDAIANFIDKAFVPYKIQVLDKGNNIETIKYTSFIVIYLALIVFVIRNSILKNKIKKFPLKATSSSEFILKVDKLLEKKASTLEDFINEIKRATSRWQVSTVKDKLEKYKNLILSLQEQSNDFRDIISKLNNYLGNKKDYDYIGDFGKNILNELINNLPAEVNQVQQEPQPRYISIFNATKLIFNKFDGPFQELAEEIEQNPKVRQEEFINYLFSLPIFRSLLLENCSEQLISNLVREGTLRGDILSNAKKELELLKENEK